MSRDTLQVIDQGQKVPFLRGVITHTLTEKGFNFQEAYEAANLVRDRLREREQGTILKEELSQLIEEVVAERFGPSHAQKSLRTRQSPSPVIIVAKDLARPFSKGLLSQSLQATGLEPSVAYDIAREIEGYLQAHGRSQITRQQLRKLIYETISSNYDSVIAERYLLWRCVKSLDKPLMIFIGGSTGVGKSTIATEVSHRLGIQQMVSTDTIRQIMRTMFSRDLLPTIYYSSYEAWQMRAAMENEDHATAVVEAFKEQSVRVMVGVRAIIDRGIQENTSLVIDGVHLIPGLMDLKGFEGDIYAVHILLSTQEREKYLKRFPSRQGQAQQRSAARYKANFTSILQIQGYLLEMASAHGVRVVENDDLDKTASSAVEVITDILRERLQWTSSQMAEKAL